MIKINVELEFNEAWLESVVCSALEGGINYWINDGFNVLENIIGSKTETTEQEYLVKRIAKGQSKLLIRDDCGAIKEGMICELSKDTIIKGYERYIKWCTDYERSIFTYAGDIDAEEADIIVQLGLFNEVIFG